MKKLFVILVLTITSAMALAQEETVNERIPLEELRNFADVYNRIRKTYVNEVDDSTLLNYAIEGMLKGLDPHSSFLHGDTLEDLEKATTGEFTGLGIEVGIQDGYVTIIAPIDGSPAAAANLKSGDVILKIDDTSVKNLGLSEAIEQMRGPLGSKIKLMIGRPGESQPFDLTLVRDTIKVASVRERWLDPGYGYIRIAQFQAESGNETENALKRLMDAQTLKGLVIDLRNNPGGVLRASVEIAGLFLKGGTVVYTEGRLASANIKYSATPYDKSKDVPVVVLINGGSASASEIVAGALQDHARAVIMGTKSFGKGSVQTVVPLSEDKAVKLTTALYFTPNGRSIQARGIEPDVLVEYADVTTYKSDNITEASLKRHLDNVTGAADDSIYIKSKQQQHDLIETDNQLFEALTLLKGLNVFNKNSARLDNSTPSS